jgi:hypothetical protein
VADGEWRYVLTLIPPSHQLPYSTYPIPLLIQLWPWLISFEFQRVHDRDPVYEPFFLAGKPWPWKVRVAGQEVVGLVTPEQVDSFAKFDNTYATERFPSHVHVLNVGGGNDSVVPPWVHCLGSASLLLLVRAKWTEEGKSGLTFCLLTSSVMFRFDTLIWQRAFQARAKSACLHVVEEADHNLIGVRLFFPSADHCSLHLAELIQFAPLPKFFHNDPNHPVFLFL